MDCELKILNEIISREGCETCQLIDEIPVFAGEKSVRRLNGFYTAAHAALVKGLTKFPTLPPEITVTTKVTTCDGDRVSLYRDFKIGDRTVRTSDNWLNGFPLTLRQLGVTRRAAIAECIEQAAALDRSGYASLWPDYPKRIKTAFKKDDFYIRDGKAVIYFPAGTVGPERLGILQFSISLEQICSPSGSTDA